MIANSPWSPQPVPKVTTLHSKPQHYLPQATPIIPNYPARTTGSKGYLLAQGGNTQNNGNASQTNTAASFIALYGDCPAISGSSFVFMSEVTTVATMAAVSQFFNPADSTLKADATGQQRLIMLNLPNT